MSADLGPTKLYVDGITHYAHRKNASTACGKAVYDRSLDHVIGLYVEGASREVDCMACIAYSISKGDEP